jgi:hypothetical protein
MVTTQMRKVYAFPYHHDGSFSMLITFNHPAINQLDDAAAVAAFVLAGVTRS